MCTILPALVVLGMPQPAGAASRAFSASTRDRDANGRVDTVSLRGRGTHADMRLGKCHRPSVGGRRILARRTARGTTTLRLSEGRYPDTGVRLTVHCRGAVRGAKVRTSDHAKPAPLSVSRVELGGGQRVVVVWSEPVRVVSRLAALRPLDQLGGSLPVQASGLGAGNRTWVQTSIAPAGVTIVGSRIADRIGNRGTTTTREFDAPLGGAAPTAPQATSGPPASSDAPTPPASTPPSSTPSGAGPGLGLDNPGSADGLPPGDEQSGTLPASATDFVDSIGVNTHVSYYDTAYGDFPALKNALFNLGVRHIRDAACAQCWEQQRRFRELAATGIRADLLMSAPGHGENVPDLISMIETRLQGFVDGLEGPNEYDTSGPGWVARARDWQSQIYAAAKASPALRDVPVIAPSMIDGEHPKDLGDISNIADCGNWHPYPDGYLPTTALAFAKQRSSLNTGSEPLCVTEVGYHNATSVPSGNHNPVSEAAAGAYVPRLFLDYFAAGVPRTFLYELVDERSETGLTDPEQHFGLLRSDWSPKPAYTNLRNLITLTRTDDQAKPRPFDYSVSGATGDVRQILLQQDAKHVVLVLWRDVSVWNRAVRAAVPAANVSVDVTLKSQVRSAMAYGLESTTAPIGSWAAPNSVRIAVPPRPIVVRFELP
jgi:hypothetical protein